MRAYEARFSGEKWLDTFLTSVRAEAIWVPVVLTATVAAGLFLRVTALGAHGLWTDELYHALAAQALLSEGRPAIPLMGEYTRALPFTWLVAFSFKVFGISEFAARLPSVLIGTIFIPVVFLLVRKLFNTPIALLTALMVALSPLAIELSRESRMYPLFQLLFFVGVYFFFTGFEPQGPDRRYRPGVDLSRLGLAAVFLLSAAVIHSLTINLGLAVFAYLLIMTAASFRPRVAGRLLLGKHALLLLGAVVIGAAALVFQTERVAALLEFARSVPAFSTRELTDYGYYRYYLSNNYPALFFLYPLSGFLMVRAYGRKGLFFSLLFIVLLLAHTFVFGRKLDRYLFYIMPFFFLGVSFAVWRLMQFIWAETRTGMNSQAGYALGVVCCAVAFNVFGYPWLANSRHAPEHFPHTDWKTLDQAVVQEVGGGTVMTSRYKPYLFYFDEVPEYVIMKDGDRLLDQHHSFRQLSKMEELQEHFQRAPAPLYLVLDEWSFKNQAYFDQPMRDFVLANCEPVAHQGDPKIMIFRRKE